MARPTKFKESMCETVIDLMQEGASKTEVCAELGIGYDAFLDWQNEKGPRYKESFSEAIKIGEKLSEAWWLKQGRVNLKDGKFNSTLWYMNMKNRHGWADKKQVDHTSKGQALTADPAKINQALDKYLGDDD